MHAQHGEFQPKAEVSFSHLSAQRMQKKIAFIAGSIVGAQNKVLAAEQLTAGGEAARNIA